MQELSDIRDCREFRSQSRSQGGRVRGCCCGQALPGFHGTLVEAEAMVSLDKAGTWEVEQDLSVGPQLWLCVPKAARV